MRQLELKNIDGETIYDGNSDLKFVNFVRSIARENDDNPDDVEEYCKGGASFSIDDVESATYYLKEYGGDIEIIIK